ncbi:MAG: ATP-binding protein [Tumebacillaceae bacterium]
MFYATRRVIDFFFVLIIGSAIAAFVFNSIAFTESFDGQAATPATLGAWCSSIVLMAAIFLSLFFTRRLKNKARQLEATLELITPLWDRPEEPSPIWQRQGLPKSVHHLLQSLDVQRNIMKRCFELAPFGVVLLGKQNSIVYANTPFTQLTQYRPEELDHLQGRAINTLFVTESQEQDLFQLLADKQGAVEEIFCYLRQKDGTQTPSLITGFPLTSDVHAGSEGYILFVRDVSPSHQLQILQQQYHFLLNSLNQGVVVTDLELNITYVNHAFCEMFSNDQSTLLGRSLEELTEEEISSDLEIDPFAISRRLADFTLESGENQNRELVVPQPSGHYRCIQISTTPIKDTTSSNIGVLLFYQDRTAEKELQETIRRHDQLETVSQMAASIAHEVRNPMTSVQGFLQLMSKEIDPAHTHSMYLHVMEEDLKRINNIITEYLNFSRMGSDSLEDVWIGTLLHNLYTLLESEANLKGIQLELTLSGNNPLLIANPHGLKQVLINLARNAMEAMREAGGTLTLALETTEDHICLMVRDTGPGIDTEHLARIFNPFYTTKKTGTGLGLFISKKIIDEHNGTIRVQSEAGKGTTFAIYLPKNRI